MNPHTVKVLEYDRITEKLHDLCWSVPAKRIDVTTYNKSQEIEHSLDCLSELIEIYHVNGGPPSLTFGDVDQMLEKCAAEGNVLEPAEMAKVADLYYIVKGFTELDEKYSNLNKLTSGLIYSDEAVEEIENAVDRPNDIKSSASPKLKDIRQNVRRIRTKLEAKYNSYLDSDYSKYLSDNVVTVRDGRFVLPVREGDKSMIKGVVHDRSSTGVTFFIEPFEAVELNNNYRELLSAEKQEVYRILRYLTDLLLEKLDAIKKNVQILVQLDLYSAKARFAIKLKCNRPLINRENHINIIQGYHPLLRWRDKENGTNLTIPLDIELGENFSTLVITGPNTGGKTVALKTVGLLCCMAQSGMFIPAAEGSSVSVFSDIYADIGDEQSLEASLSTFSAHLSNIRNALTEATSDCLVLLDEIGAGTDPDEGAALGQAIIENLAEKGILSIITTHHGKLKALAVDNKNIENASLDFDSKKMTPTYNFRMGVPGLSYAIETARKLGLADSITNRAESLIDRSERKLSAIITELSEKLQATDEQLLEAENSRISYESLTAIYAEKIDSIEKEKKKIKKESLEEAERMIRKARTEINELIDSAKRSKRKTEALRSVKREADTKIEGIKEQIKEFEPPIDLAAAIGQAGEKVYMPEMQASGEIVGKPDKNGRIRVKIGNVVLVTELRKLFKAKSSESAKPIYTRSAAYVDTTPETQIDLRGMTFDEAQPILDRYLDDVSIAGLERVTIVHGKGTGALRTKIQNHLKSHFRVKSFRLGNWNEGSYGATIAEIKRD
ncbi:MAG: endonuclease MutS2 [candidate division Zixibacteria bacterium]|nr:endonuclease MutS2 [candidate division Zixibacteria bacterium]